MFKMKHKIQEICNPNIAVLDGRHLCALVNPDKKHLSKDGELVLLDYIENQVVIERMHSLDGYSGVFTIGDSNIFASSDNYLDIYNFELKLVARRKYSFVPNTCISQQFAAPCIEKTYEGINGVTKKRALYDCKSIGELSEALPDGGPFHVSGSIAYMAYVSPERRSKLYAYDFLSKTILWEHEANGSWFFVGAGKNALCFKLRRRVNDEDTWDVLCLDAQTGEKKWELFDKHRDLRVYEERNEFIQLTFFEAYDIATGELKRKQPGTRREIIDSMPMRSGHYDAPFIGDHVIYSYLDLAVSSQPGFGTYLGAFNMETLEFDWFHNEVGTWMLGSGSMQYKFGHLFIHDNENTIYIYDRDENWWQEYEKRKRGDGVSDTLPPPQLR